MQAAEPLASRQSTAFACDACVPAAAVAAAVVVAAAAALVFAQSLPFLSKLVARGCVKRALVRDLSVLTKNGGFG